MPWIKDTLHVASDGTRWVADVFRPAPGEGYGEIRLKRRLAREEPWPPTPPTSTPKPDPEIERRERMERYRREVLDALRRYNAGQLP